MKNFLTIVAVMSAVGLFLEITNMRTMSPDSAFAIESSKERELQNAFDTIAGSVTRRDARVPHLGDLASAQRTLLKTGPVVIESHEGKLLFVLGDSLYGGKDFLRIVDSSGSVKQLPKSIVQQSVRSVVSVPKRDSIDVLVGGEIVSVGWVFFDWGMVDRNSDNNADLTLKNCGSRTLVLDGFAVSCGCIKLSEDTSVKQLAPGEAFTLGVTGSIGESDELSQSFRVRMAFEGDADVVELKPSVFANARLRAVCVPPKLDFGFVSTVSESSSLRIRLKEAFPNEFRITGIYASGGAKFQFDSEVSESKGRREFLIRCIPLEEIEVSVDEKNREVEGNICIETTSVDLPEIRVPYRFTVSG